MSATRKQAAPLVQQEEEEESEDETPPRMKIGTQTAGLPTTGMDDPGSISSDPTAEKERMCDHQPLAAESLRSLPNVRTSTPPSAHQPQTSALTQSGKKDEPIIISDSDDGNFFLTTLLRQVTKFFPEQIWNPALYAPYLGQFLQVNIIRTELSTHAPPLMMFWTEFTVTQCNRVRNLSTRLHQHPFQMLLSNGIQTPGI